LCDFYVTGFWNSVYASLRRITFIGIATIELLFYRLFEIPEMQHPAEQSDTSTSE
jgi:hypothetical protein